MSQVINQPDILTRYETAIHDRLKQFLPKADIKASYNTDGAAFDKAEAPCIYICLADEMGQPSEGTARSSQLITDTWAVNLKVRDFGRTGNPSQKVYPMLTTIKAALRYEFPESPARTRWVPWDGASAFDFISAKLLTVEERYVYYQILFTLKPRVE